jgi:hypothetical protein
MLSLSFKMTYIKSRTLLCMFLVRPPAAPEKGSAGAAKPPPQPHQLHTIKADLFLHGDACVPLLRLRQPGTSFLRALFFALQGEKRRTKRRKVPLCRTQAPLHKSCHFTRVTRWWGSGRRPEGTRPPRDQDLPARLGGTQRVPGRPVGREKEGLGGLAALQTTRLAGDRVTRVILMAYNK